MQQLKNRQANKQKIMWSSCSTGSALCSFTAQFPELGFSWHNETFILKYYDEISIIDHFDIKAEVKPQLQRLISLSSFF